MYKVNVRCGEQFMHGIAGFCFHEKKGGRCWGWGFSYDYVTVRKCKEVVVVTGL